MRTKLVAAGITLAFATPLAIVVTGIAGTQEQGNPFGASSAAADELVPFEDCSALLQWYVDKALPHVGPYGLGGVVWTSRDTTMRNDAGGAFEAASPEANPDAAVSSSATGTNVQEAGVDEPDLAKTDGDLVVHLRGDRSELLVITDVSGPTAKELGTLRLPPDLVGAELLLSGDTVLVVGSPRGFARPMPADTEIQGDLRGGIAPMWRTDTTRVLEVSIADPADPEVLSDRKMGGELLSARQYADTVRLVLSTTTPTLDFVSPDRDRSPEEATEANRQIVERSTIDDWLPSLHLADGERAPLVSCSDVRHPVQAGGFGTVSVVTFPVGEPDEVTSTAVTASADTVYSSTDRLYLATSGGDGTTDIHAFALDGTATSYVASGNVDGALLNRWSMDEYDGVLRVVVAHGDGLSVADNGITTLRERDGRLVTVGSVRELGPNEQLKAVRWFDELAVVVTFRQTDPVYTVDLSDPARPRTLGELKIPGFSQYLHPIGDDRLLGLGYAANARGVTKGAQVAVFDIADLTSPRRLDVLSLGKDTSLGATYDPRAFTWLPDATVALMAVTNERTGDSSIVEVRLARGGAFVKGQSWRMARWSGAEARALPLEAGSVALVGNTVQVVEVS